MPIIPVSVEGRYPIPTKGYARNGKYPDASFMSELATQFNQLARLRPKLIASFFTPFDDIPASATGTRTRWRFAWHSSPFAKYVGVRFWIAIGQNDGGGGDATAKLSIIDDAFSLPTNSAEFHASSQIGSAVDVPENFMTVNMLVKTSSGILTIPTNTALYGQIEDIDRARIVAATVYEFAIDPDVDEGFLNTGFAAGTPIYDLDRQAVTEGARDMWKHGAAHLWNWSVRDADAFSSIVDVPVNVIDGTSTATSAATPGVTLDLTNCSTVRRAADGIPVVFKVYAEAFIDDGHVTLCNSGGPVLTITVTGDAGPGWYSATGFLPVNVGKYDIRAASSSTVGSTIEVYSASLYQYET